MGPRASQGLVPSLKFVGGRRKDEKKATLAFPTHTLARKKPKGRQGSGSGKKGSILSLVGVRRLGKARPQGPFSFLKNIFYTFYYFFTPFSITLSFCWWRMCARRRRLLGS